MATNGNKWRQPQSAARLSHAQQHRDVTDGTKGGEEEEEEGGEEEQEQELYEEQEQEQELYLRLEIRKQGGGAYSCFLLAIPLCFRS